MKDPEFEKKLQEFKETVELHEHYKKHQTEPDDDGANVSDNPKPTYVGWDTSLCVGCHMPINRNNELDADSIDSFLESPKKYDHPLAYVASMHRAVELWEKGTNKNYRYNTNHFFVDEMMRDYKDYLPIKKLHKALRKYLDEKGGLDCVTRPCQKLVYLEENMMGGITEDTKAGLYALASGKDPEDTRHYKRPDRETAATMYLALALRHNWDLDRKVYSTLMRRSKNVALKQEAAARTGKFRMSAIRGTVFKDCLPSYHYIKKHKPELLDDAKWTAKKLRFDKSENRLVILRYFIDKGMGLEHLEHDGSFLCAVAKLLPGDIKDPDSAKAMKRYLEEAQRGNNKCYGHVFGDEETRKRLYDVDSEYRLAAMCTDIEEFFRHVLGSDRDFAGKTDDPVEDLLKLPTKEDL